MAGSPHAPPEMRHDAQARIRKQVDRISDMIGEILDFTQGSQSAVILAPLEYGHFVQRLLEEIRPEAALKSTSVELDSPLPEVKVLLDPKRLRRVFNNLIHNATDAMPRGGKVMLRFIPNKTEIVTEIEDTGPGIAPEIAGQLFEAFATHGKAHGTGLGLSICKRIIEDHRGWISARNESGRGAVFSFGLPLTKRN
jgi:signal transduction histidine kinase